MEGIWGSKASFLLGLMRRDCRRKFDTSHVSGLKVVSSPLFHELVRF